MSNKIISNILTSEKSIKNVPKDLSIIDHLINRLKTIPLDIAIIDCASGRLWTTEMVCQSILNSAASWINEFELQKGDTVCFVSYNNDYYAISIYGVIAAGGIVTGTSDKSSYREIRNVIEQTNAKLIVASENNFSESIEVLNDLPQIKNLIVNSDDDYHYDNDRNAYKTLKSMLNYDYTNYSVTIPVEINDTSDTIAYIFTSGSTGIPKAVIKTHENFLSFYAYYEMLSKESETLTYGIIAHLSGIAGFSQTIELIQNVRIAIIPEFSIGINKILEYIGKYKINMTFLAVSSIIQLINCDHSKYDISSLVKLITSGTVVPKDIAQKLLEKFPNIKSIVQFYEMTETIVTAIKFINDDNRDDQSLGSIVPENEIKIVDIETNETLGPNKIGEICVRGPQVTKGYLNQSEETPELFDGDGFLKSGDSGYYDENGNIYFYDRYKHIIKYNAYVVSPIELESILLSHPSVAQTAVIGVDDEIHGELPKAFVVKKKGYDLITEQELFDYVNDRVETYKYLRGGLVFVENFIKTSSGKINKTLLC